MKRVFYGEAFEIIVKYANEMLPYFADKFERFPVGGNAAMIVAYLNDRADFWRDIDRSIAEDLVNVAGEIIFRSDRQ